MSSQAITSLPGRVTVLAAVWVTLGRCVGEPWSSCDNGKVLLDNDLPRDTALWDCPSPLWQQSQRRHSVDTVFDPELPQLKCMDQQIIYNLTIPNNGDFRPVRAESGEYLYCPPQRWLNNLHHGASVLLYHPCSSLLERRLLSALARSCLSDFILTPHNKLDKNRPVALVSWGRTLEVSTVTSSDICDWLHSTSSTTRNTSKPRDKSQYNLLLIRSVDQDRNQEKKGTLKQCCERTLSSFLADMKTPPLNSSFKTGIISLNKGRGKRAALKSTMDFPKVSSNQTSSVIPQLQSNALPKTISTQNVNQSGTKNAVSQSTSLKENPIHKKLMPNTLRTTTKNVSLDQPAVGSNDNTEKVESRINTTAQIDFLKQKKPSKVDDLDERGAESTKSQAAGHMPNSVDCQCKPNQVCECGNEEAADRNQEAGVTFQRTPRTDEAVWAAGALGFLLVLLTLSILHTRLYKHWRRGTSLYWHDPQQDYDSVADVIRRRLRITKRRRKRGRKKEIVLLPSSSSSEEYP